MTYFRKILTVLGASCLVLLGSWGAASATTTFIVGQGGTGTTTFPVSSLLYGSGTNPIGSVATTSVTCTGSTTCTSFTAIGSSPITINSTGGGTVTQINTTWPVIGGPFTFTGTLSFGGLSTSSPIAAGAAILYATGVNTLASTATSTLTGTGPISVSNAPYIIGASGAVVSCATASGSVAGCLAAADFSRFNSATTTFSTGLTYTLGTNAVTVNTSQNITTLSNLTANGVVTTSGGAGTLGVVSFLPYANGGTNGTGFTSNQLVFANGTSLVSASSTAVTPLGLYLGLGTTTPRWLLQLATSTQPQLSLSDGNVANSHWTLRSVGGNFYLGTSSPTTLATSSPSAFTISNNGQVSATEANIATSTNITVDWNTTPNQVLLRIGASATTIAFNNASTSGMTKRIVVCNPGQTAGAITWNAPVEWAAATVPVQTTTSNQCDVYSFIVSYATSTTKVFGAGSTGFN